MKIKDLTPEEYQRDSFRKSKASDLRFTWGAQGSSALSKEQKKGAVYNQRLFYF